MKLKFSVHLLLEVLAKKLNSVSILAFDHQVWVG